MKQKFSLLIQIVGTEPHFVPPLLSVMKMHLPVSQAGHGLQSGWNWGLGDPRSSAGWGARRWPCAGWAHSFLLAYFHLIVHVNEGCALLRLTQRSHLLSDPYDLYILSLLLLSLMVSLLLLLSLLVSHFFCLQVVGAPITTQVFSHSVPAPQSPQPKCIMILSRAGD